MRSKRGLEETLVHIGKRFGAGPPNEEDSINMSSDEEASTSTAGVNASKIVKKSIETRQEALAERRTSTGAVLFTTTCDVKPVEGTGNLVLLHLLTVLLKFGMSRGVIIIEGQSSNQRFRGLKDKVKSIMKSSSQDWTLGSFRKSPQKLSPWKP